MIVLIDGDIVVFRAGFASNTGPFSHALHNTNLVVKDILSATQADDYTIYIKGTGNYRTDIPSEYKYKGNRKESHRPIHEQVIREHLQDTWGAVQVDGMETDDALGIAQTEAETHSGTDFTTICSIDKDLLMIPGNHYNFVKQVFSTIGQQEGLHRFLQQMIVGDRADNIFGIPKYGPVAANRLLPMDISYKEGWKVLENLYNKFSTEDALWSNARLLWISRTKADDFLEHHEMYME